NGRLLAIGFRRNFRNCPVPLEVRKCVHSYDRFLMRSKFREIILGNVEVRLNIVEIGESEYRPRGTCELPSQQLSLFNAAFEDRACDGSANYGSIQQRLLIGSLTLSLSEGAFGARDFLGTRSNFG